MYSLWFDGLFQRVSTKASESDFEAGLMGYGWVILKNHVIIAKGQGVFGRGKGATSGVAEYLALIEGLDALLDLCSPREAIDIHGDAKFIIDQMTGLSEVTSETIKPLHRQVKDLTRPFTAIQWIWTPRKHNRTADALSRHAMFHLLRSPTFYRSALQMIAIEARKKRLARDFLSLVDLRIYQPKGMIGAT
jgi:ribonuclease HI